jgi:hypothetical protein
VILSVTTTAVGLLRKFSRSPNGIPAIRARFTCVPSQSQHLVDLVLSSAGCRVEKAVPELQLGVIAITFYLSKKLNLALI